MHPRKHISIGEMNRDRFVTERLIIRRPAEYDLEDYLAFRNHSQNLQMQPADQTTRDRARNLLIKQSEMAIGIENAWVMFGVELKEEGQLIGEVGAFLSDKAANQGNLGWIIHPDFHRLGYASEAVAVLLRYVFEVEQLHRVTANCPTFNEPSYRLMERLGMRRESHMRESREWKGKWFDEYVYALLNQEWRELRQS